MNFPLRRYQTRGCISVVNAFKGLVNDTAFTRLLLIAGTGSGKTVMASALMEGWTKKQGKRVLFLADSDELCAQSVEKFHDFTGIIAGLEKAEHRAPLAAPCVVGSIQTLSRDNRLERFPQDHFGYVIADEAHLSLAPTWLKVLNWFHGGGARILGLTATPGRGDKKSLMDFYEHVAAEIPMAELIGEKQLSPITVETVPLEITIKSEVGAADGDNEAVAAELTAYYSAIITAIGKHAADRRRILIFHPSVNASRLFASMLRQAGHTAAHVDGMSPDRAEIIEGYAQGRYRFLNNCQMLIKGFDNPPVDCVIILRPTRSRTAYIQMAGRGTRLFCPHGCREWCSHPDRKQDMLLLDFLWEFDSHDVMGPADLFTESGPQREEVARRLKTGKRLDLLETDQFVTSDREADLLAKLKRQAGKRGTRVDALAAAALLHQPGLLDYEPVAKWEAMPVSPAQREFLERHNIDPESVKNRGHANAIGDAIGDIMRRKGPTMRQLLHLTKAGIKNAHTMTISQASDALDRIYAKR